MEMDLCLKPYESVVILACDSWDGFSVDIPQSIRHLNRQLISAKSKLLRDLNPIRRTNAHSRALPVHKNLRRLKNLAQIQKHPALLGFLPFKSLLIPQRPRLIRKLRLTGQRKQLFSPSNPFGRNELAIEVTNTLGNENKDFMSQYTPVEPFGLLGPVMIEEER